MQDGWTLYQLLFYTVYIIWDYLGNIFYDEDFLLTISIKLAHKVS
jgi:hypothetical protein